MNKLILKKRYFRSKMKECTLVEQDLKLMKDITDKLAAIGAPISEEDQVVLRTQHSLYSALSTHSRRNEAIRAIRSVE